MRTLFFPHEAGDALALRSSAVPLEALAVTWLGEVSPIKDEGGPLVPSTSLAQPSRQASEAAAAHTPIIRLGN